mgnify:FL=1
MLFTDRYDSQKSLEEQVTFPIRLRGRDVYIRGNPNKEYTIYGQKNTASITPLEAKYAATFVEDQYATINELLQAFHAKGTHQNTVEQIAGKLKRACEFVSGHYLVQRRTIRMPYENESTKQGIFQSGYYIGDLSKARNEPENLATRAGFILNLVTGYFQSPTVSTGNLSGPELALVHELLRNEREVDNQTLQKAIYNKALHTKEAYNKIHVFATRVRKKIGPNHIARRKEGYKLVS